MPGKQIDEMVYELQKELRGLLPEVISLKIQTLDNLTQWFRLCHIQWLQVLD